MIKGIFFEASDIFYTRKESARRYALRLLRKGGYAVELSAEEVALLDQIKERASDGQISAQTYWDRFLQVYGVADSTERTDLRGAILEHVNKVSAVPGARETAKVLKERGFILGIASSTMYPLEWKMAWLAAVGVAEFMDVIVCTATLGMDKSHPGHYWAALNKARLTPRQAAFVSNGARELAGARQVGMVTVAVLGEAGVEADYYAKTLADILELPIFRPN